MNAAILNARELGQALRAERKALGRSQNDLALSADCRRQTILDLEAGKNVSLNTLMATLAALGKGLAIIDARPDIDQISSLLDPADED